MKCRRCARELPEGETLQCPFCGIRQDTYIVPRGKPARFKRAKMKRGTFLSMISVALVVFIVAVLIPVLRGRNLDMLLAKVEDAYQAGNRESLAALLANLKRSYPAEEDKILGAQEKLDTLTGKTDDPALAEELRRQRIEDLIGSARDTVMDITGVSLMAPSPQKTLHLTIRWKNTAAKAVTGVKFSVEGIGANGAAAALHGSSLTRAGLTSSSAVAPGEEREDTFLDVWDEGRVTSVRLVAVTLTYADKSEITLPAEVLDALFNG